MNTFYTAFAEHVETADDFHCTHKYLGVQHEAAEEKIVAFIEKFFAGTNGPKLPPLYFGRVDFYGENYQRVIGLSDYENKKFLLISLRRFLDLFRKDDFENWRPHITTTRRFGFIQFQYFVLMKNNKVFKSYKL